MLSIVVPAWDEVHTIGSVLARLSAVLPHVAKQIIVVDDGSTDGSASVALAFGDAVRYRYQPSTGVGAARNRGTAEARGRFLAFLDADDLWIECKLEIQLAAFEADPALEVVFGHVQQGFSPELDPSQEPARRFAPEVVPGHLPGTMLARRDAFFRVGPFSTALTLGDGVDWYLRAVDLGLRMLMLHNVLLWRRVHDTNMGIRQRDARQDYVHVVKAALDRRRSKGGSRDGILSTRPDDSAASGQE
jgi:glycosyltransferase involved in cell wall biosynthesis